MVLIIQNQQKKITSELCCVDKVSTLDLQMATTKLREINGRNPLGAALAAVAQAIGGLPSGHSGHRGKSNPIQSNPIIIKQF